MTNKDLNEWNPHKRPPLPRKLMIRVSKLKDAIDSIVLYENRIDSDHE